MGLDSKKFRPLRNCLNVVLTRNEDFAKEVPSSAPRQESFQASSKKTLKNALPEGQVFGDVFVIGGASVQAVYCFLSQVVSHESSKQFECLHVNSTPKRQSSPVRCSQG